MGIPDFGTSSDYLVVKVTDSDDNYGIGYIPEIFRFTGKNNLGEIFNDIVKNLLGPYLVGKDADFIEYIWNDLFEKTTRWGRRGLMLAAIGVLDMALWDLKGKTLRKPVWRLLGAYRDTISTYANTAHDLSPDDLAKKALEYVEMGFNAVKIRGSLTAVPTEIATERIRKVREAIGPDISLMVDLNGTYTFNQALRALKKWEKFDLFWVEEPVHPDDLESYKRLKKEISIPIAAGEQHGTIFDFKQLLESEAIDIVQPDVIYVGGVTEWLKVSNLAKAYGIPVSPHLNQIVSSHLVGSSSNGMWIEYTAQDNPLGKTLNAVFSGPSQILHPLRGKIKLPEAPGFGFEMRDSITFKKSSSL